MIADGLYSQIKGGSDFVQFDGFLLMKIYFCLPGYHYEPENAEYADGNEDEQDV